MALDANIGCFVVDNFNELHLLNALAADKGKKVNVLLRITPGVEAHTHEYISTGQTDSKFGFDLGNGTAYQAIQEAASQPNLDLLGVHSHIGSQIFEVEGFAMAVDKVAGFAVEVREELNITFSVINLGGGFGIRYVEGDTPLPICAIRESYYGCDQIPISRKANYPLPEIWVEPGRSMVGDAGTTLYTVGTSKDIPGVRKYIAVDGGMTDNPRPALYESKYEAVLANRANEPASRNGICCG